MNDWNAIEQLLDDIEELLRAKLPSVAAALRPPASRADIERKEKAVGLVLPDEIHRLLAWHDGQSAESFSTLDNRVLLSIDAAADAYRFFHDPTQEPDDPPPVSWFPVFTNGAGDYVMVETESERRGALFNYWHDDEDRSLEAASLEEYLLRVRDALDAFLPQAALVESLDMSDCVIALVADRPIDDLGFLRSVHELSGSPIGEIRRALVQPGSGPFFEQDLSRLPGVSARFHLGHEIRNILRKADAVGASVSMYITPRAEWSARKVEPSRIVDRTLFERMITQ